MDKNNERQKIDDLIFNSKSKTNGLCHSSRIYHYPPTDEEKYKAFLASFDEDKLVENINSFIALINKTKPSTVKGKYMLNVSISTTMGPGIKIDVDSLEI